MNRQNSYSGLLTSSSERLYKIIKSERKKKELALPYKKLSSPLQKLLRTTMEENWNTDCHEFQRETVRPHKTCHGVNLFTGPSPKELFTFETRLTAERNKAKFDVSNDNYKIFGTVHNILNYVLRKLCKSSKNCNPADVPD